MVSICLKSFDKKNLNNLEQYFDTVDFPNIFYSIRKFKYFYNFIIHYKGSNTKKFYDILSDAISNYIIDYQEALIVNTQLKLDFFYFTPKERNDIFDCIAKALRTDKTYSQKKCVLRKCVFNYFKDYKKCNLDGFINFRINSYRLFLSSIIEDEIHNYVIKKEYLEYVTLLKDYVNIKQPQTGKIHLIYSNTEKILLDENGKIITTTNNKKYLSDISFSDNDFILNSIISLMPQSIIIHLHGCDDNFIQFLKLIYENKCTVCDGCSICLSHLNLSSDF